jgi:hypothetical protein
MDKFDEVFSCLTEEQGWSPENANKIMVYCAEQGMNPIEAGARFVAGMAGLPSIDMRKNFFNPWNMFPKKPEPQKGLPRPDKSNKQLTQKALPPSTVDAVVSKPQGPQQPVAPKPAWRANTLKTGVTGKPQGPQQPVAPIPQFGGSEQAQNIKRINQLTKGPIGDNTISKPLIRSTRISPQQGPSLSTNVDPKPQFSTNVPAPKPAWNSLSKVKPQVSNTLSNVARVASTVASLRKLTPAGVAAAVMEPRPTADGTLDAARKRGDLNKKPQGVGTLPRVAEPYRPERPKASKEEPVKRSASKLSAAAKDFDKTFASARDAGKGEFTWRGKRYSTKLK